MVIASKENYNLLMGHGWIHKIGVVPSTLHQRLSIWCPYGIVKNIKVDHSCFTYDVNVVNKRDFDKNLATILHVILKM